MRRLWHDAPRSWSLVAIIALSIALGFSLAANLYHNDRGAAIAAAPSSPAADLRDAFVKISEQVSPSVVNITSEKMVKVPSMPSLDDFFGFPFGNPRRQQPEQSERMQAATGSGVIVRSDGYILTNNHVVAGADRVTVRLKDGREFKGDVKLDPDTDLALVKIDAKNLPALPFADSDKIKVGEWVMAVGSPFQLRGTVTVGVVSAIRTEVDRTNRAPYYVDAIQTDASINPGNSGGPLVDLDGRIVGINGMIYSPSGGNVGIGFAIPSTTCQFVMKQLIEKGKVVRGYLGIEMADLTPVLSEKLGAKTGAVVSNVAKDSAAEKAGLQTKDVIIRVDGKDIHNGSELRRTVQAIAPGTEIKVVVIRDKKEKTLNVKLGEAPGSSQSPSGDTGGSIGLSVQPLTPEVAKQLGVDQSVKGVVVRKVDPGSAADRAGIEVNDVITEIDDMAITSVASFSKAEKQLKKGDTAIVVVQRGERSVIVEMPID
jgi:serine protease Do